MLFLCWYILYRTIIFFTFVDNLTFVVNYPFITTGILSDAPGNTYVVYNSFQTIAQYKTPVHAKHEQGPDDRYDLVHSVLN